VFVGEITRLGPVFQGVCKEGVGEDVDVSVGRLLFGDFDALVVHTSYINCSRVSLPSPPFTLHAQLIVYCEEYPAHIICLNPVPYSERTLQQVQAWIAFARLQKSR
jgi:hypothetical protein